MTIHTDIKTLLASASRDFQAFIETSDKAVVDAEARLEETRAVYVAAQKGADRAAEAATSVVYFEALYAYDTAVAARAAARQVVGTVAGAERNYEAFFRRHYDR